MTLTTKQKRAIKKLQIANKAIFEAEQLLIELNGKGKQFDYVNCPELSSIVSGISIKATHVDNIVYQKTRK